MRNPCDSVTMRTSGLESAVDVPPVALEAATGRADVLKVEAGGLSELHPGARNFLAEGARCAGAEASCAVAAFARRVRERDLPLLDLVHELECPAAGVEELDERHEPVVFHRHQSRRLCQAAEGSYHEMVEALDVDLHEVGHAEFF